MFQFIQVELLGDEQWAENTTCVTGNTSERSVSYEDLRYNPSLKHAAPAPLRMLHQRCGTLCGTVLGVVLCVLAYLSPVAMVVMPRMAPLFPEWHPDKCGPDCEGLLISFGFKLAILALGMYACYGRRSLANLPRVFVYRAFLLALVFLVTFAYWLFYGVRILQRRDPDYKSTVTFALSLVDALLFIHYLSVILLEIRHLRPEYKIRVVRSPDGESRTYSIGQLSIQRAAYFALQYYYRDFPVYNPFLERLPTAARQGNAGAGKKDRGGGGSQVSVGSRSNQPNASGDQNALGFKVIFTRRSNVIRAFLLFSFWVRFSDYIFSKEGVANRHCCGFMKRNYPHLEECTNLQGSHKQSCSKMKG